MANFCEKCGTPLAADAKFCIRCGAVITRNETQNNKPQPPMQQVPPQPVRQVQQPMQRMAQPANQVPTSEKSKGKKGIIAIIAVLLAVVLAVGGFFIISGSKNKENDADKVNKDDSVAETDRVNVDEQETAIAEEIPQSVSLTVGTGGAQGTYYAFTSAVCQVLNSDTLKFKFTSTGGSQANIEGIYDGEYQMAIVQNDVMNYAYEGVNGFAEPIRDFSAVACVYPEICQIVVRKDSGITSVADLKGKTVAVGDAGSGVYYNATQILAAAGIDIDKDINKVTASFGDSANQLKDGSIQAAFITAGTPTAAITELSRSTDIAIIPISDDVIAKLVEAYPFYTEYIATSDDYGFITEPVKTVAMMATYVVSNDLSEDVVYEITKNLWEKKGEIQVLHAKGEVMDINKALAGLGNVPLHPGAERYYREKGIEKPTVNAPSEQNPAVEENSGVEIPDVSYNSLFEGEAKLRLLNLDVHLVPEFDDSVEPGTILRIEPESGAYVPVGSVVTIYYSTNVKLETVPNVLNMMIEPATQTLEGLGLEVVIEQMDDKRPKGTVFGQSIIDEEVERGTVIILFVSTGVDPGE